MVELYSIIVVECGIAPDYFLDKMQWYEIDACLKGLRNKYKPAWEQARTISHTIAQVNSKKKLKATDVMKFDWDDECKSTTNITLEDRDRYKDRLETIKNNLNEKRYSYKTAFGNRTV